VSRRLVFPLFCTLVTGFPTAARAAAEGGSGFLFEVMNLVLLLGVLGFLTRKPISNYLAERRDTIRNNIESAEKLYQDAESRLAEWQERAAGLDAEVESIREAARKSAEHEAATVLADARATAERIQASAHATVERELRRARAALRDEAANLAVELAAGQLREQVTDADRDRLVDEFVSRIESGEKS
jgi:F-type H+-transporting ATPase subunit b